MDNREFASSLGRRAKEAALQFSPECFFERVLRVVAECVAEASRSGWQTCVFRRSAAFKDSRRERPKLQNARSLRHGLSRRGNATATSTADWKLLFTVPLSPSPTGAAPLM
jgi:hypothetical protein